MGAKLLETQRVVVTESPIECVSWMALHEPGGGKTHCRTYGGNRWRYVETIFDQIKETQAELVCSFNNDEEGNRAAQEFEKLAGEAGITSVRDQPQGVKDWNDLLKMR